MNWPSQCVTLPVDARCDDHDDCTVDECNLDQGCINREMDCEDEMGKGIFVLKLNSYSLH